MSIFKYTTGSIPGSSAPALFAIGRRTQRPDLPRKIHRGQMLVELAVKTLALRLRHSRALDPKLSLLLFSLPLRKHLRFYLTATQNGHFFNSLLVKSSRPDLTMPQHPDSVNKPLKVLHCLIPFLHIPTSLTARATSAPCGTSIRVSAMYSFHSK